LLSELSRCAWEKEFFQEVVPEEDAVPGAVIAIHSFGDFLGWHPHLCVRTALFNALEWLAAMCSHVPNKGEQMVRL